jgi:probable HAF family extracellular repeat protein
MKAIKLKNRSSILVCAVTLFVFLATSFFCFAAEGQNNKHHHYKVVDVGTFGGPSSWMTNPAVVRLGLLNNQGALTGEADTSDVDPFCWWAPGCYPTHGFQWKNGVTTDLGVLPGGIGSEVNWISANGLMVGIADNGQQDPLTGLPQIHGVLWKGGTLTDLGALFGGYDTWALSVNSRGEIVGEAYNTIPDPSSMFGYGYQSRAFYWNNGVVQDLGTLGAGNDAAAGLINERGQVIGVSYTSSTPNAMCADFSLFTLTTSSFLWDRKNGMKDIGGLGGTCTLANDLNNQGQIVGGSSLAGDTVMHAFVWNAATGITDLVDPSDSSLSFAEAENSHGDVAGQSCNTVTCYAVLWRKHGGHWERINLNTADQVAVAFSINASEQVVGNLYTNGIATAAFLSEDGGPVVDLNTLIPPGSGLQLYEADQVNDLGEISVQGADASGNNHVVLLIPCDENHPDVEGCDYSFVEAGSAINTRSIPTGQAMAANQRSPTVGSMRNVRVRRFAGRLGR